jgi:hypothetical protein
LKFLSEAAWKVIEGTISAQREDLRMAHERIDRLTEALSKREQIPLIMPQTVHPIPQNALPSFGLENSPGWFDVRRPVPPTPPKVGGNSK